MVIHTEVFHSFFQFPQNVYREKIYRNYSTFKVCTDVAFVDSETHLFQLRSRFFERLPIIMYICYRIFLTPQVFQTLEMNCT